MKRQQFSFDIDVTGACNLRCPCCPQGNSGTDRLSQGFMDPALLTAIVRKTRSECRVSGISLFNWTEPLLHPGLPELVRIVEGAGIPCHLSSNLNLLPDADAIMAAGPTSFKISVSGFSQEVYGTTHRGGDIELVKKNMARLAEAKKRHNAATRVFVTYHRYRHNLHEEPLMRDFAASLGFAFEPVWALMFPLEKLLACAAGEGDDGPSTPDERSLIDLLAYPLAQTLAAARTRHDQPCRLRDRQISLDFQGNVLLCCGVFDPRQFTIGNYLTLPLETMQRLRHEHEICRRCMQNGIHAYLTYDVPEMERQILATISPDDRALLNSGRETGHMGLCRRLLRQMARLGARATRTVPGKK